MKTYPYAPLLPHTIPMRLSTAATMYGMELGFARGQRTPVTDHKADIVTALEDRAYADIRQLERGPLEAVTR